MKLLTAKVIDGQLDLPEGILEEGVTITLLVPEKDEDFELTQEQQEELAQALAEADRGEGVDGWQFLAELGGVEPPPSRCPNSPASYPSRQAVVARKSAGGA